MKIKKLTISSQLLILLMAALVMGVMVQFAQAAPPAAADNQAQVLRMDMPQKSLGSKILDNLSLSYYTQFLGPTLAGTGGETYNVFVEGRSPYQSFHSAALRYQIDSNWAAGVSLAAVNAYGDSASSQQAGVRNQVLRDEFFNARAFINTPSLVTPAGTLFTTVSYEAPTSVFSRENDMKYGLVLAQSFAFKMPGYKLTAGLMGQYYRMFYKENVVPAQNGYLSFARQTTIASIGPYLGYRFNDHWGMNSSVTFDWDQRGDQTGTGSFNNNLPDRARVGVNYYPTQFKQIANVGLFTQGLIKYTTNTQAFGGELALKF